MLGALEPRVQFVVAKQDYKVAGVHKPEIRVPGMAMVFSVKEEMFAKIKRNFRVGFQSVITFVNIDGGQKGRPLLEIATETRSGAEIMYATYGAIDEDTAKKPPTGDKTAQAVRDDVYLNFSPAIVMSKNHMILCSTRQIAEELADLIAAPQAEATIAQNIAIDLNAAPVAALIRENRDQLVAHNMLDKGHDPAAAEKEVGLLEAIVLRGRRSQRPPDADRQDDDLGCRIDAVEELDSLCAFPKEMVRGQPRAFGAPRPHRRMAATSTQFRRKGGGGTKYSKVGADRRRFELRNRTRPFTGGADSWQSPYPKSSEMGLVGIRADGRTAVTRAMAAHLYRRPGSATARKLMRQ